MDLEDLTPMLDDIARGTRATTTIGARLAAGFLHLLEAGEMECAPAASRAHV